ncbi:hypothetical protein Psal006b_02493 [Piscirickettsia salmonis]|uniref:Uncharacterized protein n=2 Tax=Piscirickettsia salmonis TaxID=1238 RepID=A0A1L6TH23_PISSA|nr:hypothetical protein [Piscirickettsia salmonis]AKP73217.2 hypothetical protein PSLF89_1245 [Piscirickettsia salmonis LF-89 = ATCC VR-1361]ALB21904.1 hypothetical protein KU39_720 [Piscirickettsia salmonis]ALY04172.1 hypothetical protein AWE47_03655 [Piscirickettsia salmonis]AMA43731.1 hypothetical protein AWJ11_03650 [Piscirickettsia salmonis]AOS36651.1 hypothetical protein AVM72_00885 [Piscirickettsia salmonis]
MPKMNITAEIRKGKTDKDRQMQLHFDSQELAEAFLDHLLGNFEVGQVPQAYIDPTLMQFRNNPFGFVPGQSHDRPQTLNFPCYEVKHPYSTVKPEDQEYGINFGSAKARDGLIKTLVWATEQQGFDWFKTYEDRATTLYIKQIAFEHGNFLISDPDRRPAHALKGKLGKIKYDHLLEKLFDPEYAKQVIAKHSHLEEFIQLALRHTHGLFRDTALKYCLAQLGDSRPEKREPMVAKMATATQGGRASVCHFLLETYVKVMLEENAPVIPGLLERVLLARYLQKHAEKFGIEGNPELLEGLLNAVFLPNSQIPECMPIKFQTPYQTPPAVIDTRTSFGQLQVRHDSIHALRNLLWQDECFNPAKLDRIIEAERGELFREIPFAKAALIAITICGRNKNFSDFSQLGLFGNGSQRQQCIYALAGVNTQTDNADVIHAKVARFTQQAIQAIHDRSQQKSADSYQEHPQEQPRVRKRKYQSLFHDQAAAEAQAPARQAQIGEPDGEPEPGAPEPGALR